MGGSAEGSSSRSAWRSGGYDIGSPTGAFAAFTTASTRSAIEAPSMLGDYMAAVLACGAATSALSHRAEAHVMQLLPGKRPPPPEVTVPTLGGRARPGIVIHRVKELHRLDTCIVHGIRMTTVPRTLLDLAPALDLVDLTRACHEAWIHHRTPPRFIEDCIARNPGKKGIAKLRAAIGADATLSKLEDGFLDLLRSARPAGTAHERRPQWRQGRLPLAAARSHRRAAQLPLPRVAAGVRDRRRAAPAFEPPRVHLGRRLRAPRPDDRRADRPPLASAGT